MRANAVLGLGSLSNSFPVLHGLLMRNTWRMYPTLDSIHTRKLSLLPFSFAGGVSLYPQELPKPLFHPVTFNNARTLPAQILFFTCVYTVRSMYVGVTVPGDPPLLPLFWTRRARHVHAFYCKSYV